MKLQFLEPTKEWNQKSFFGDVITMDNTSFFVHTPNMVISVPYKDVLAIWDEGEDMEYYYVFLAFAEKHRNALRMKIRINPKQVVETRN